MAVRARARAAADEQLVEAVVWCIVQDFMLDRISPHHDVRGALCPHWYTRAEPARAGDRARYLDRRANIVRDADALLVHLVAIATGAAPRDHAAADYEAWFFGKLPSSWGLSESRAKSGMDRYPHAKKRLPRIAAERGYSLPIIGEPKRRRSRTCERLLGPPDSPVPMWDVRVAPRS
jgi:hypothetical protein